MDAADLFGLLLDKSRPTSPKILADGSLILIIFWTEILWIGATVEFAIEVVLKYLMANCFHISVLRSMNTIDTELILRVVKCAVCVICLVDHSYQSEYQEMPIILKYD